MATLSEVVERVIRMRPTGQSEDAIAKLVIALDGRARMEATGAAGEALQWPDDQESALFIAYPFDDAYVWYTLAEIDALNYDTSSAYQNDAALFNEKYSAWLRWYTSRHGGRKHVWRGMHTW